METVACSQTKHKRRRRRGGKAARNTRDEEQPSFPNIPEEIILQILQRLPLDSLSRFKCVSKTWCSLISDFTVEKRGREMVLVVSDDLLHSIDIENSHGERLYESEDYTRSSKTRAIYGSCNGLLLMGIDQDFFLWNPLTGYFKKVLHYDRYYFRNFHIVSGLCYDSSTDDYKVVMALVDYNYSPEFCRENVVVGSFKSKSWTEVDCSSYIIGSFSPGPTVNEHLHWIVSEESKSEYSRIFYFNTKMGTFEKVPMPQPKPSDGDVVYGLGVLDGCLCMSRSGNPSDGECNYIEVLAMKEYGMANSWTRMFIISDLRPFGYTRNGEAFALKEPLWCEGNDNIWHMSVYNPIDDSTRDIPIPTPMRTAVYNFDLVMYEESVIKPTDYNWEDEELRGEATYVEYFLDGSHHKMKMKIKSRAGFGHTPVMRPHLAPKFSRILWAPIYFVPLELKVMKDVYSKETRKPMEVLNYLKLTGDRFPNAWTAYRILLTILVTVAFGERSFSKLKLIKSYLRSTMSQERLNGLAMLSIEKDIVSKLDYNSLITTLLQKMREG